MANAVITNVSHVVDKITPEMIDAAIKIDDLDDALRPMMNQIGIDDGGVAAIAFMTYDDNAWPDGDADIRRQMINNWIHFERIYEIQYPTRKEKSQ